MYVMCVYCEGIQNIGWPLALFLISRIHEWIFFDPVETESSQIADKTYDTHLL